MPSIDYPKVTEAEETDDPETIDDGETRWEVRHE